MVFLLAKLHRRLDNIIRSRERDWPNSNLSLLFYAKKINLNIDVIVRTFLTERCTGRLRIFKPVSLVVSEYQLDPLPRFEKSDVPPEHIKLSALRRTPA